MLGALAGARRTDSAYGRFLERANAFDVAVVGTAFPIDMDAVRRLPQVADSAGLLFLLMESPLVGPVAVVVANLIAAGPGRMPLRVRPVVALKAE